MTVFVRLPPRATRCLRIVEEVRRGAGHAVELVQRLHKIGFKVGLCFHVGSQVEEAEPTKALKSADWVRNRAGVPLVGLDVGGGFPAVLRP
jgi:ornithine decarboxylase